MPYPPARKSPVLVIAEDDPDILYNLVEYFESMDFTVYGVLTGELALEMARRVAPDLIITDLIMPGLCGFSLLQRLSDLDETRGVPVLVLSARVEPEMRERAQLLGAVDFVTKPFSLGLLRQAVETALDANLTTAP